MVADCTDVCECIIDMLLKVGVKIDLEDPDHQDILFALGEHKLVKKGG